MRRFLLHQSLAPAVLLIVALFCGAVKSQTTAVRPDRGINPGGSYSISDIENINLENGNVNLSIPLASLPPIAGGKLKLTVSAVYNSKLWNVTRSEENGSYFPYRNYVVDTPQQSDAGGWQISGGYDLFFREAREDFSYQIPADSSQGYEWHRLTDHNWYKLMLRTPDGAEHELRPSGSHEMYYGLDHPRTYLWGYYCDTPDTTGSPMRYESSDGTYLSAIVNPAGHASGIKSTVFLSDGTQVISYSNGIQRIRDNNGNTVKVYSDSNGQHYQDEQTGREIRVSDDPGVGEFGQKQVWYQTVGGDWQHIDINFGETVVQGKVYKTQDWNPNIYSETGQLGAECTRHQQLPDLHLPVIRDIIFPVSEPNIAGRRFTFAYTSDTNETATTTGIRFACGDLPQTFTRTASHGMGALSHIETPAGAIIDYTYTGASQHDFIGIEGADQIVKETLTKKVVTHDGGIQDTWDYDIPHNGEGTVSSVTNPDGSSSHQQFFPIDQGFAREIGNDEPRAGLVYYTTDGLTGTYRHWIDRGVIIATGSNHSTTYNPLVDAEYTWLAGTTLMSAKLYQHDYNGNVTQVTDYDWFDSSQVTRDSEGVPTAPPANATVLRVTNTSYYNPAPAATSANYYALRTLASGTPSILNAPQETTTGPAITRFSYDYQAYGAAPTVGNLTSQSTWDDVDNKWISSSQTYGLYGNLATKMDARGKVTQFFYDDATHALPNRVLVDPQNDSGSQTTIIAYDFSTGVITNQTDPNGNISTIGYTNQLLGSVDPFGRPGITTAPAVNGQSRQTRTYYADSTRTVTVVSDLNAANDGLLKSQVVSDMLGRTFETRQYETTNDYITVRHAYDSANRIEKTSNPFRSGEPTLWTTSISDVFGRVISVTTPDSAVVSTSYSANAVTVTDQAGKQRKSVSDALGRLKEIYEDPGGLNYQTSYGYDVFGNLLTVNQGSQARTFNYDSLSRLRSASNPESGTITYAYDDNGNLSQKTDARGVVSTYAYDALNRNTSVSYANDPASTPAVNRYYDGWRQGASANPSIPNSLGRLWQTETSGSAASRTTINGFDALGRPTGESQQFYASGAWSQAYTTQRAYNLTSAVLSETYPSGRNVTYAYDTAGRATTFSGTLGDGQQKDYSSEILYSPFGAMTKEKFGTDTAIYNKLFYNSRGQLAEIRESTSWTGPTDTTWDRGAIINYYSNNCWGMCGGTGSTTAMTDNNGNLKKQETFIPGSSSWLQQYDYDALNRLQRVHENTGNTQTDWQQEYVYDRYGNRRIEQDVTKTYGLGINKKDFTVNTANNRLGVPSGQSGTMSYDLAGSLTTDTYSGSAVTRLYDAENRMTKETQANSAVAGDYTYNADGQRVRRKVNGVETWQVYGFDGELLAEYAANGSAASPQKEYGYRNGQLLITAEPSSGTRTNVAAAANGGVVSVSSEEAPYSASYSNDGERLGYNSGHYSFWRDNTASAWPDWLQIDFNGSKTIDEIDVYTVQDNPETPVEPTESMTFSLHGITDFDVQYWNGTSWATVPNGSVTGNNKVWKKLSFSVITTSKIRVMVNNALNTRSRIVELEAWGTPAAPARANVAAAANGGVVSVSSEETPYSASYSNDAERLGYNSGHYSFWRDNTASAWPDWLQIDFNGSKAIDEIDVLTVQDNAETPTEPTESMTFSLHGITDFDVQYWNGSAWATVPNGSVTGNNKVWKKLTFSAVTTSKIRVTVNNALNSRSRIVELEAWGTPAAPARANVAAAANGGVVSVSSEEAPYSASYSNDGERLGYNSGHYSFWRDNTASAWPDWLEIDFNGSKTIDEIDVLTVQDNAETPTDPTESMTFSLHGITDFDVQYWNGSAWATVPSGSVTGNNKVWRKFSFTAVTTSKIRVTVNNALNSRSRIVELEAWTAASGGSLSANINWLVTDQLGTPRMIFDRSGSLATTKRHDYAPFGEELFNGTRSTAMGYAAADSTRQKFTQKERDNETGLDYFLARYYSSTQGRFTSADDFLDDAHASDPTSWNLYAYVRNNPLRYLDPTGETVENSPDKQHRLTDEELKKIQKDLQKKAGLQSIHFDTNGKLTYDPAEKANGGSSHFRQGILGAINDSKNTFQLADYSGDSKLDFTDSRPTNPTAGVFEIRIDFGDYANAKNWSNSSALAAFSIGLGLYHEIDHWVSYDPTNPIILNANGSRDDIGSSRGPGVIDDVNVAQRELNLMTRAPGEHNGLKYNGPDGRLKNTYGIQFTDTAGKSKFVRWQKESQR